MDVRFVLSTPHASHKSHSVKSTIAHAAPVIKNIGLLCHVLLFQDIQPNLIYRDRTQSRSVRNTREDPGEDLRVKMYTALSLRKTDKAPYARTALDNER